MRTAWPVAILLLIPIASAGLATSASVTPPDAEVETYDALDVDAVRATMQTWQQRLQHPAMQPEPSLNETPVPGLLSSLRAWSPGDIDGDGYDDVLIDYTKLDIDGLDFSSTPGLLGLAGPDLGRQVLSRSDDAFYGPLMDHDGDGRAEVARIEADMEGTFTANGRFPFYLYQFDLAGDGVMAVQQADLTRALAEIPVADVWSSTSASVFPLLTYAQGDKTSTAYSYVQETGVDRFLDTQLTAEQASLSASAILGYERATVEDLDATFRLLDASGKALNEVSITGQEKTPLSWLPVSITGPGDVAVAWLEDVPASTWSAPVDGVGLGHVTALLADGTQWTYDSGDDALIDLFVLDLADLTGDGLGEVEVLEAVVDPDSAALFSFRTRILDGSDGSVLHDLASGTGLEAYLTLGDADGEGAQELLRVAIPEGATEDDIAWSVTDASLQEIWQVPAQAGWPINFIEGDETGGLADWDGDGLADVAFMSIAEGDQIAMTLYQGADGTVVYDALFSGQQLEPIQDLSLVGDGDMVVFDTQGIVETDDGRDYSQTSITAHVIAAETGKTLWTQVLRSPSEAPVQADHSLRVAVDSVGDIDADGRTDLFFRVQEGRQMEFSTDRSTIRYWFTAHSGYFFITGQPLQTTAVKLTEPDPEQPAPDEDAPAIEVEPATQDVPPAEAGEAAPVASTEDPDQDSPMPLVPLLAALAVALWLRRR